ncbi:uncharacterized protein [Misgurnus anguillicaudatus]|uniref:uncharacterized protein n=1 Tax=Misgurnus anguillicaudatus TaxID=75329 RepID=UPI003CCF2E31
MSFQDQLLLFTSDEEFSSEADRSSAVVEPSPVPSNSNPAPKQSLDKRGRPPQRPPAVSPKRRRLNLPSPPPARHPRMSPSVTLPSTSPIPAIEKWTVNGLRLALASADIDFSRKLSKAQLYELYLRAQTGQIPVAATQTTSKKGPGRPRKNRQRVSANPRPSPTSSASRASPPATAHAPSPVAAHAPPTTAVALCPSPSNPAGPTTAPNTSPGASYPSLAPTSASLFANAFPIQPHLPPSPALLNQAQNPPILPPSHFPPGLSSNVTGVPPSVRPPPLMGISLAPPHFPLSSNFSFPSAAHGVRLPPQTAPAPDLPLLSRPPSYTLLTAVPLAMPAHAVAMDPPPVSNSLRSQILSGMDVDLAYLLSPFPKKDSHRSLDCGTFSVVLKDSPSNSNRILSFAEFVIAFNKYTEVICSVFPNRRKELNDYLAIISDFSLSFGGCHFYTYHKLFSAKCATRVTHWNQCPYWEALDFHLYNRVFLGCRNISCAICRSLDHQSNSCPSVKNTTSPRVPPDSVKSTSYAPQSRFDRPGPANNQSRFSASTSQVCNNFNEFRCSRQRCRYLHVCNFCGGAHARPVCPVYKSSAKNNKDLKKYLSSPINVSALAHELQCHPNKEFTNFLLSGLQQGFDPGLEAMPNSTFICNNLQSARLDPDSVDSLLQKEVESKFMISPFDSPPFLTYRINPIGIATRKFSGNFDLSAPHECFVPMVNSLIPLSEFSLHYHDVDQAISLIKSAGPGAWLAKIDITSAFKVMPINPDFWHLFGVLWREKYYFAVRLTFGCKSSPKIFDTLSEA